MRVLVLSGGGAKGAFQAGALAYLETQGYRRYDAIFGVSVGALNAAGFARGGADFLLRSWFNIEERDVTRRFSWLRVAWRILRGKLGAYDNTPLLKTIRAQLGEDVPPEVQVGYVDLLDGEYRLGPAIPELIWASTTIPVIWPPVDGHLVDGGVRDMTPLGDALKRNPSEIIVILCNPLDPEPAPRPRNILEVALRALSLQGNEIARDDIRQFQRINDLVQQAEAAGLTLRRHNGQPYRYVPITVIEPTTPLGSTLDFSQKAIRERYQAGMLRARQVLGGYL